MLIHQGARESRGQSMPTSAERQGTTWAGCQSIAGLAGDKLLFTLLFTQMGNLD